MHRMTVAQGETDIKRSFTSYIIYRRLPSGKACVRTEVRVFVDAILSRDNEKPTERMGKQKQTEKVPEVNPKRSLQNVERVLDGMAEQSVICTH